MTHKQWFNNVLSFASGTRRRSRKIRQGTAWSVNVYRAWDEYRNTQIETVGDEYRSVPVDLGTTPW